MRADDFNEKAMEAKIQSNLQRGFTEKGILILLEKEKLTCLTSIRTLEMRISELSDQIDYMKEKHVKPD